MKTRDLFIALALLALAAVLFMKQHGSFKEEGKVNEKDKRGGSSSGRGGIERVEKSDRDRVKSDRVFRERTEMITTESGLKYEVLKEGKGERPGPTSKVEVHYVGTFEDGTIFDSSRERGQSAQFGLNAVIKGWTEGLQLMRPGAQFRFIIPPELAYGDMDRSKIPGGSTLVFEVELLGVEGE